jgi:stage II sporulation protein D
MRVWVWGLLLVVVLVGWGGCQKIPETLAVPTPEPHLRVATGHDPLQIREIDIEHYLMGVLAGEIYADWPEETLMAQAVASRTYALYRLSHPAHDNFDMTATVSDQVFDLTKPPPQSVMQAVRATRGEVLEMDEVVVPGFFHSCCGGHTEIASNVWSWAGSFPYFDSKPDPYCKKCKDWDWEYSVSREELEATLTESGFQLPEGWFINTELYHTSPRVWRVVIMSPILTQKPLQIAGVDFRRLLGYSNLKSTIFSVNEGEDLVTFYGRGFGHGVGMCQWGARGLALKGAKYDEILNYYYPQTTLVTAY